MKRASIATLAVLALLLSSCSNKDEATPSASNTTTTSASPTEGETTSSTPTASSTTLAAPFNDHGSKDVSAMSEFELELDDFYFNPSILKGKAGQTLKLELKNEGSVEHNFTLAAQNLSQDIDKGEKKTITVSFPSSGSLEFNCKYHVGSGMKGALSV